MSDALRCRGWTHRPLGLRGGNGGADVPVMEPVVTQSSIARSMHAETYAWRRSTVLFSNSTEREGFGLKNSAERVGREVTELIGRAD